MASEFTVFSLADLFKLPNGGFYNWLFDNNLLIDFSDVLCECGSAIKLFKDSAYQNDGRWKCVNSNCW